VCLAKSLREQGADTVGVCTHNSFKKDVLESTGGLFSSGASFFDIGTAPDDALRDTPEGKELANSGIFNKLGPTRRFMAPLVTTWMKGLDDAVAVFKPDTLVLFTTSILLAGSVLEKLKAADPGSEVGVVWCHLAPFEPTATHAPPAGFGSGRTWSEFSAKVKWGLLSSPLTGFQDLLHRTALDLQRQEWGLVPLSAAAPSSPFLVPNTNSPTTATAGAANAVATAQQLHGRVKPLTLMGYSPTLCPPPLDWDLERVRVVGSLVEGERWGAATMHAYKPPLELFTPLGLNGRSVSGGGSSSVARPIVFTFGSALGCLTAKEQKQLLSACVRAACELSVGAVIFTKGAACDAFGGRNHNLVDDLARNLLTADSTVVLFDGDCPHDWLFSRAGAVACHGGAGTVHAALTAGCPVVVSPAKPDDSDQPWWGGCVKRAGVGTLTQRATLNKSGKTLAASLRCVLGSSEQAQAAQLKAKEMGSVLRDEGLVAAATAARLVLKEANKAFEGRGKAQKPHASPSPERSKAAGGHAEGSVPLRQLTPPRSFYGGRGAATVGEATRLKPEAVARAVAQLPKPPPQPGANAPQFKLKHNTKGGFR